MSMNSGDGALARLRVVEFAGIGPVPFCGMVLADMGAEVTRIERPAASDLGIPVEARFDHLNRGKRSPAVGVKHPEGVRLVHALLARSDVVLEGFRTGTMERLGFGPDTVLAAKPALGKDSAALLAELGYSREDVISLRQQGVIRAP